MYKRQEEGPADAICRGAMFAGVSWNCSSIAQIHACNHPITEVLHIAHGDACAILLPWFVEWNGENKREKFWKVYNAMYPLETVAYKDFDLNVLVKKLMKLNYDLNILNNMTMDEYAKSRGIEGGCPDEPVSYTHLALRKEYATVGMWTCVSMTWWRQIRRRCWMNFCLRTAYCLEHLQSWARR